jgi:ABC-type sugar transport system substrate-binding protein
VAEINNGKKSPYGVEISNYANAALKATGWKYTEFDAQSSVAKIGGYMRQAVQEHYDAVIIEATDMSTVAAPAQEVLDAKIPLICISCDSQGSFAGKVIDLNSDWETQGEAAAAAIVATEGTKAKVVRFNEPNYISVVSVTNGVKAGMAKYCSLSTISFSVTDLATPGPPVWSAFLASHPGGSFTDVVAPGSRPDRPGTRGSAAVVGQESVRADHLRNGCRQVPAVGGLPARRRELPRDVRCAVDQVAPVISVVVSHGQTITTGPFWALH